MQEDVPHVNGTSCASMESGLGHKPGGEGKSGIQEMIDEAALGQ